MKNSPAQGKRPGGDLQIAVQATSGPLPSPELLGRYKELDMAT